MVYLCDCLNLDEVGVQFKKNAVKLKAAILEHCWDERDGFFYSVDLNLLPNENITGLHMGQPRDWDCLIQRIGVWSGFLALWSGNPSSWLGPVWGISNYLTFRGLVKYSFMEDAAELAEKTIALFGRDLERFGALHEYYQPENGEPILNRGFQNWNYLVLNMIAWLEGKTYITEF